MQLTSTDPITGQTLLLGKGVGFWIKLAAVAIPLIIVLATVLTNALVQVSYTFAPEARQGDVQILAVNQAGAESKLTLLPGGFALVPRSTKLIALRTQDSETTQAVGDLPLVGWASYSLELLPQTQVSKIAGDTSGCNMTNPNGTFTFGCGTLSNLAKVERPDKGPWVNTLQTNMGQDNFERYLDGFLSFKYDSPEIAYVVPGGETKQFSLPSGFVSTSSDSIRVITDTASSDDKAFVVANLTSGEFLYQPGFDNTKDAKRFSKKISPGNIEDIHTCAMNAETLACYYGPSAGIQDEGEAYTASAPRSKNGKLELISLKDTSSARQYDLGNPNSVDDITIDSSGTLYAISAGTAYAITVNGSAQSTLIHTNVTAAEPSGDTLYISSADSIMQYSQKDKVSHLKFHSSSITSPNISVYGDSVIINAFLNISDDNQLRAFAHAYKLTNNVLGQGDKRKEDILPYKDINQLVFMDYDDSRIYVSMTSLFTNNEGTRRIDVEATNKRHDFVRDRLQADGLLSDKTKLIFQ
jgi:hypothetical protein